MSSNIRKFCKINPWKSFDEWNLVYNQVYSNNHEEQRKSYETLLLWKSRTPKLSVGVDCTLELLEVFLRDRDWTEKINRGELPIYHENDLTKLYAMSVIRCLNHMCNIGKTKDSSLYKICQKMNIPNWIVDLRHDASHDFVLPPLELMRDAANFLLDWLHREYWYPESKFMQQKFNESMEITENVTVESIANIIELWIAVGLYMKAGYKMVKEIGNSDLRKSIAQVLSTDANEISPEKEKAKHRKSRIRLTELSSAQTVLISELTKLLKRRSTCVRTSSKIICDVLVENEVFMPNPEFLTIFTEDSCIKEFPKNFLDFWEDFIVYLQDRKLLQPLFLRLLEIVQNENANKEKRLMSSLWIKALVRATFKQICAIKVDLILTQKFEANQLKHSKKNCNLTVEDVLSNEKPELDDVLTLKPQGEVLSCLRDERFLNDLATDANEYGLYYVPDVLDLIKDLGEEQRKDILEVLEIVAKGVNRKKGSFDGKIYTVEDLELSEDEEVEDEEEDSLTDSSELNLDWKLANDNVEWRNSPIGILPWQKEVNHVTDSTLVLTVLHTNDVSKRVPGFVDTSEKSSMDSNVKWDQVIKQKNDGKRKENVTNDKAVKKKRNL